MNRQIFLLVTFSFLITAPNKIHSQESLAMKEGLNLSAMNEADAYKAQWTYECAQNSNNPRIGLLCGVEFAKTVEKYDIKYKTIFELDEEQIARKLVKSHLINVYMDQYYRGAINIAVEIHEKCHSRYDTKQDIEYCIYREDPLEEMERVYQKAKEKLKPLEIYNSSDLKKWEPRKMSIVE